MNPKFLYDSIIDALAMGKQVFVGTSWMRSVYDKRHIDWFAFDDGILTVKWNGEMQSIGTISDGVYYPQCSVIIDEKDIVKEFYKTC